MQIFSTPGPHLAHPVSSGANYSVPVRGTSSVFKKWYHHPEVAAARYTLRRIHRICGVRGVRGGKVHRISESSPRYSRGYRLRVQLGGTPREDHSIVQGTPTPIQLLLGVTSGVCGFVILAGNRSHGRFANHNIPHPSGGME